MKWLALWYLVVSLATFIAFAIDKRRARLGLWRTPERTLHAFSLAGGFAGAIAAMFLLRHKNRKAGFWVVSIAAGTLHILGLLWHLSASSG